MLPKDVAYTMLLIRCCLYDVAYTMLLIRCCLYDVAYTMLLIRCCLYDVAYTMLLIRCCLYDAAYTSKADYVFRFFFLAAGKSMLLRISRYPGEFGCKLRSVSGSCT